MIFPIKMIFIWGSALENLCKMTNLFLENKLILYPEREGQNHKIQDPKTTR